MNPHKKTKNCILLGVGMLFILLLLAVITLSNGAMKLEFGKILRILWAMLTQDATVRSLFKANEVAVIWEIRLPRILCGIFVGGGLAVAGAIFQAILCNPLADPYTLGVSTGAAFGASLAILCSVLWGIVIPITAVSMATAFLTLLLVIFIAEKGGGLASENLIISGIIISSILSSGISFLKMMAGENVGAIVFWLMGSLSSRHWADVLTVAPVVTLGLGMAFYFANDLNIMLLGDESAQALGINTGRTRLIYLIIGACITAACVAVSGIIGFIGLVVPHMLRFRLTSNNRALLPLSALAGAIILSIADNATRLLSAGEIPVGVLTTLIGGPFFIYVFVRRKKYEP